MMRCMDGPIRSVRGMSAEEIDRYMDSEPDSTYRPEPVRPPRFTGFPSLHIVLAEGAQLNLSIHIWPETRPIPSRGA